VGRYGNGRDIANAVWFLCSENASFITGQAITVDGGLTLALQVVPNPHHEIFSTIIQPSYSSTKG
jgi:hypothetical protein